MTIQVWELPSEETRLAREHALELLDALKKCAAEMKAMHLHHHPTCEGGCPYDEAHQAARTAIAKATT